MSVPLDARAILAAAEAETGLSDYGDPTLPQRFSIAVDHLDTLGLDDGGRRHAAETCRWLLTSRLEFFAAYPDATLVWLHRDPVQVAASRTMMMADILEGIVGPVDLRDLARDHLGMTRAGVANTMTNPLVDDPRILHVRYTDFVADPVGTVGRFYEFSGRDLTAHGEHAMRTYLAENRGDRHGKFRYSTSLLTDIGEDLAALHDEFRPFRERFGVEVENRD